MMTMAVLTAYVTISRHFVETKIKYTAVRTAMGAVDHATVPFTEQKRTKQDLLNPSYSYHK